MVNEIQEPAPFFEELKKLRVERDIELIGDQDKLERHIGDILSRDLLVDYSAGLWTIRFLPFRGEKIIRIDVPRQAPRPILAYQSNEQKRKGGDVKKEFRFVRSGSKTQPKSPSSWATYILDHWGKSR